MQVHFDSIDSDTIELRQVGFGIGNPKALVEIRINEGENDFDVIINADQPLEDFADIFAFIYEALNENGYIKHFDEDGEN